MLNDTDGTKFNQTLVSIVSDYIHQRVNERVSIDECYEYISKELDISTTKHHLIQVIAKVSYILKEQLVDEFYFLLKSMFMIKYVILLTLILLNTTQRNT